MIAILFLFVSQPAWAQTGTITIVKDTAPNSPQDFAFYAFGPNSGCCSPFQLDDDTFSMLSHSKTFTLAPGSYGFKEDFNNPVVVTGWTLASIVCTGGAATVDLSTMSFTANLAAGQNITCTFRNTPTTGTITIVKDAAPNNPQDFAFYSFGPNSGCCNPFQLDDDVDPTLSHSKTFTLAPGSYAFKEDFSNPVVVTGWTLAGITCSGGGTTVDLGTMSFTASLTAGQNITCTFRNTTPTGTIRIIKDATPNSLADFAFTSSVSNIGFALDDDASVSGASNLWPNSQTFTLAAGSYTFSEIATAGWGLTNIACLPAGSATTDISTGSITANLTAGQNITCTFVN
ncbi:MAG: prealbumin-like fold domain-containing protein, partial [Allosphingosinicella sp.]